MNFKRIIHVLLNLDVYTYSIKIWEEPANDENHQI